MALDRRRLVRISKFLSTHLRHRPERLGLELQAGGWVDVDTLLRACARVGFALTRAELDEVVARNDKRRFALDPARTRIRANQGHSVPVDLGLLSLPPPRLLFHGTNRHRLDPILAEGLRPMGRHHVHLSLDVATAHAVGARRGPAVVLEVAAATMAADGQVFYRSANGVWLVAHVPPRYLRLR